jgi:hypothetical protein
MLNDNTRSLAAKKRTLVFLPLGKGGELKARAFCFISEPS